MVKSKSKDEPKPAAPESRLRTIGDIFYETRVLGGRHWTLQRFAREVLGGQIEPVMLSYIEKGERFPSEELVRRLAEVRRAQPELLLAVLWRDRLRHIVGRELDRLLSYSPEEGPRKEEGTLAVRFSYALAALPADGSPIDYERWRRDLRRGAPRGRRSAAEEHRLDDRVEATLKRHGLIDVRGGFIRRKGRHLQAEGIEERRVVAHQFVGLFTKGLLDRVALPQVDTGTYLRNHYAHIPRNRIADFHADLDAALRTLTDRYAVDPSADSAFMNVLATATLE
jgi:hypothetical protein